VFFCIYKYMYVYIYIYTLMCVYIYILCVWVTISLCGEKVSTSKVCPPHKKNKPKTQNLSRKSGICFKNHAPKKTIRVQAETTQSGYNSHLNFWAPGPDPLDDIFGKWGLGVSGSSPKRRMVSFMEPRNLCLWEVVGHPMTFTIWLDSDWGINLIGDFWVESNPFIDVGSFFRVKST